MEHLIPLRVFPKSVDFARFLLDNRYVRVAATCPDLQRVRLTLAHCQTLKPHHVVSLACLLEEYRQAGIGIGIGIDPTENSAYQYLQRLGFVAYWTGGDADHAHGCNRDGTSSRLWQLQPAEATGFINDCYEQFKPSFFADHDVSAFPSYVGELLNNVFDHAFAAQAEHRIAFALLQFYPATGRLFVAVSDFGMGIPNSVNQFVRTQSQPLLTPTEAVKQAMTTLFSSHSRPHNRGRGLDTLRTGIQGLRGTLVLQTSGALYYVSGSTGREICEAVPEIGFPGTTVSFQLFRNSLPPDEDEVGGEASLF